MIKTVVVSLLGGSGIGKSTTAAKLYGEMKDLSMSVELVREFVKEWCLSGKKVGHFGQSIIYGQQLDRESMLYGKVEYIVTDSPLILCPVYQMYYQKHDSIKHAVLKDMEVAREKEGVIHLNFLLSRNKPFDPKGRYETEKVAKKIDITVRSFLNYHDIPFYNLDCSDEERVPNILKTIEEFKQSLTTPDA